MKSYDSVVIGGGPAGMTAALYLLRFGLSTAVVEKLSPGGQVLLTDVIDNYPGFPEGIKGYELADVFSSHLEGFTYDKVRGEVQEIEHIPGKNRIKVDDDWIEAKTIIIASGASYRKLGVPGEEKLSGKGVSYCAMCDGQFFRDQVVACVGGGNSALEESLYLAKIVKKLYLIHRRDKFRGCKIYQEKIFIDPKIETVLESEVKEIVGDKEVTGLRTSNAKTGEEKVVDVDGVFIFIGVIPQASFVPDALKLDEYGFILTNTEMVTNLPGIYAAGDIRSKLCRQVASAVGDGATAAHSANLFLEQFDE